MNDITKVSQGFGTITEEKSAELAAIAVAASARAEVESGYIMALKKPRNEDDARDSILRACKNLIFAEKAIYKKPVGKKIMEGPSIRFVEEALRHWQNVKTLQNCIYEDTSKRIIKITVIDLESNLSYSKEITIEKKVERKDSKGREILGERLNSFGEKVFIVVATEDEAQIKEAALSSKSIRNSGQRLLPEHIVEEAMKTARQTVKANVDKDPDAEKRKILDAFSAMGIKPSELEKYLGHKMDIVTPAELVDLRQVWQTLKDGEAKWSDYVTPEDKAPEGGMEMPKAKEPVATTATPATKKVKGAKAPAAVVAQAEVVPAASNSPEANPKQIQMMRSLATKAGVTDIALFEFLEDRVKDIDRPTVEEWEKCMADLAKKIDEKA